MLRVAAPKRPLCQAQRRTGALRVDRTRCNAIDTALRNGVASNFVLERATAYICHYIIFVLQTWHCRQPKRPVQLLEAEDPRPGQLAWFTLRCRPGVCLAVHVRCTRSAAAARLVHEIACGSDHAKIATRSA
eukprot:6178512-Pleurochrysis_carterae.AAC.3